MTKRTILAAGAAAAISALAGTSHAQLAAGEPTANFDMTDWATGLNNVTDIGWLSDGRAIVLRKAGAMHIVAKDGTARPAGMITVDSGSEKGLLGIVVDGQDNIYLYASTGNDTANKHKVFKARVGTDGMVAVDLQNPILSMGLEGPANHDGGGLVLHKGHLYIGVGDTGANNTPPQNMYGACLNKALGKILRIGLDGSVPPDNPLADVAMVTSCASRTGGQYAMAAPDKRIYAWGFRNPWRLWVDPETDLMWIGDVGETSQEEITVGGKGSNHGWPFFEGTRQYTAPLGGLSNCTMMTPNTACTAPQHSYPRGDGRSVTGGLIPPKNCGWGAWESRYFFADYQLGHIWTLDVAADRRTAAANSRKSFAEAGGESITSIRMGPDGAMYFTSYSAGSVIRLAPKTIPATCVNAAPPADGGAAGGAGGTSGGAGGSGAAGAGGTAAGGSGTGGTASGGSGAGGSQSGAGRGGASGGTSGGVAPTSDTGCGCDLGGSPGTSGSWLPAAVTVLAWFGLRRRRRAT